MQGVLLGVLGIALAYVAAFFPAAAAAAPWLMAPGIVLLLLSLFAMGTGRRGRARSAGFLLGMGFLLVVLSGGFGAALLLPAESAGSPLLLGLPRRAAILVYGIGLLPALVLPVIYALSFEATVLSAAELSELRARLAELSRNPRPTE